MLTAALIVAAAVLLGGKDLAGRGRELLARLQERGLTWRHLAAAGLIAAALLAYRKQTPDVGPAPAPAPVGPLDLRGLFKGPTAAEDAATIGALCGELADEIAWDGTQETPRWRTGVAVDELRHAARELRCRGVSLGARQPAARDAIASHLERAVGVSGGPIDAEKRAAWVTALREVSEAAADVAR